MAEYRYKIRSTEAALIQGKMQASSLNDALVKAHHIGGAVLEVKLVKPFFNPLSLLRRRVALKERIIFTEQLAVMLKAGITLVQALQGLEEESANTVMKQVLGSLVTDMQSGLAFSAALEKHPKVFSQIFCQMIKSAESTGNIAGILERLTIQQQKEFELKGKVKGAMIYPIIIVTLLVGVIILVITFILPKLNTLFVESGVRLPLTTRILMGLSSLFVNDWYFLVAGLLALIFGFRFILKTNKGRRLWDSCVIKIPVIGNLLRKTYLARFSQGFAALAEAGVPVLESFTILRGTMGNMIYEEAIDAVYTDVENGIKISLAIRKNKCFPGMVGQLISVGEQSGDLAGIFKVLGDFFEKEVDGIAKNLSTLLEPMIMIFMGAAIGFVLISVLQPIYGLVNAV